MLLSFLGWGPYLNRDSGTAVLSMQSMLVVAVVTFYKVTASAELANPEPSLLGEIQG